MDPAAARRHLEKIGVPVVLAVRYPGSKRIRRLAVIDSRTLHRWTRRLHRRSALGQEILIRPVKNAPVMLLPDHPERTIEDSKVKLKMEPFLQLATAPQRRDLWFHLTSDGSANVAELPAVLSEFGLFSRQPDEAPWGYLAGYRPDPRGMKGTVVKRLSNTIVEVADAAVVVTRELLDHLRDVAAQWRKRRATIPSASTEQITRPARKDEGRSR